MEIKVGYVHVYLQRVSTRACIYVCVQIVKRKSRNKLHYQFCVDYYDIHSLHSCRNTFLLFGSNYMHGTGSHGESTLVIGENEAN